MDDFRKNCAKLDFKLFLIKNFSFILVRCAQPRASSVMVEKRVLTSLLALKLFELLFFASALHNCARSFLRSHLFFLLLVFYHMYHSYYTYCLINFSNCSSMRSKIFYGMRNLKHGFVMSISLSDAKQNQNLYQKNDNQRS